MELAPGTLIDRYVVEAPLGRGGMAMVYRVRHTQLDTLHALKVLAVPGYSIRDRLLAEGKVQAQLQHPNVLAVTDVLDVDGSPGLLMEYVRGPSLDRVLLDKKLSLELIEPLVAGILAGVAAAHAHGVVHRDLKPANVMMAVKRGQVIPKVADFGLVKLFDDGAAGRTRSGAAMGTPEYMAPEQIRSAKDVDARADVFALGAMFYELVTGERPFHAEDLIDLFHEIERGDYTPVTELSTDVPDRITNAIDRALKVDPDDRPQSCEALWDLWSGGTQGPLNMAARPSATSWNTELLSTIDALSHDDSSPPPMINSPETQESWLSDEDHASAEPIAPVAPPHRPTTTSLGAGGVAAIGLAGAGALVLGAAILVALVGGGFYLLVDRAPPPVDLPTAVPEPPEAAPEPVPEPEPEAPEPEPEPQPAAEPPEPSQAVSPKAAPTPSPAPAPAPAATATVTISGDAEAVQLVPVGGGSALAPGEVPAGDYGVEATFGGQPVRTITLSLGPGDSVALTCSSAMRNCAKR